MYEGIINYTKLQDNTYIDFMKQLQNYCFLLDIFLFCNLIDFPCTFIFYNNYQQQQILAKMVYIKMTNQMWVVSGLQKLINPKQITMIGKDRYIPYQIFKTASKMVDQPIHSMIPRAHIIPNLQMKKLLKLAQLTPEQLQFREQLRVKHELRQMNVKRALHTNATIKPDAYYFEQKKDETIKDFSQSISFGMTFIFSFFMAGLTGYYFGLYFIGLEFQQSMIVAAIFIMATIVIETTLYIIKQDRDDKKRKIQAKHKYKEQFDPKNKKRPMTTVGFGLDLRSNFKEERQQAPKQVKKDNRPKND